MKKGDFEKRIIVGITASPKNGKGWKRQIRDIYKYGITRAALFLEYISKADRVVLYKLLLHSPIKEIPLVHIRSDISKDEIEFFIKNFKSKYFTIHESDFKVLKKWKGVQKKLYLEMNFDDAVSKSVKVERIGGFCVDLAHFKASSKERTKEYYHTLKYKNKKKYFKCNHLNGYSRHQNRDLHTIWRRASFKYLKTLPEFVFGNVIAIEVENSIKQQIRFKKHLVKMLNSRFN
ncbi:hypothetical protein GOV14_06480 [Candidatus Pacearchaeota archaeon]|nr:hypothetical protein [Candidatus Pacearchaeota archaeon]